MAKPIVITRKLLTSAWTADVDALEAATRRFGPLADECRVAFFEVAGDTHLHVNVTHRFARMAVGGWAGPANVADGFVHNRRFPSTPPNQMIRHIRDVVFAARP